MQCQHHNRCVSVNTLYCNLHNVRYPSSLLQRIIENTIMVCKRLGGLHRHEIVMHTSLVLHSNKKSKLTIAILLYQIFKKKNINNIVHRYKVIQLFTHFILRPSSLSAKMKMQKISLKSQLNSQVSLDLSFFDKLILKDRYSFAWPHTSVLQIAQTFKTPALIFITAPCILKCRIY